MKESRDILTLFEQLNSHEVFTPPRVARDMLALLPKEIWSDPSIRILDPCVKSGVFLREALYLLFDGLSGKGKHVGHDGIVYDLNDGRQRMNHILKNMLFGIATSELTGYISRRTLYGVMEANTDKQTALIDAFEKSKSHKKWTEEEKVRFLVRNHFNDYYDHELFNTPDYAGFEHEGNIFYPTIEVKKQVDDSGDFIIEDTYYPFIEEQVNHEKIQQIKDGQMKFDVVIGNPPYQIKTNGHGAQAKPIYHRFIEVGKSINPRFLTMITPSRWFSGGMGLNSFRDEMLSDKRLAKIVDFHRSEDCFPGVEIKGGVNYFLWSRSHKGGCEVKPMIPGRDSPFTLRDLTEFDVFIRHNEAISILRKVMSSCDAFMSESVSGVMPFGLPTNFKDYKQKPFDDSVKIYYRGGEGYVERDRIKKRDEWVEPFKVMISEAYNGGDSYPHQIIGKPFIAEKGSCCTMTYVVCGVFDTEKDAVETASYLKTKFARFMIFLRKNTQHINGERFKFVPSPKNFNEMSDSAIYEHFDLTEDEVNFIENTVKPME